MSLLLILTSLALLLVFIKLLSWFLSYRNFLTKWRQFPGAESWPIVGHTLDFKNRGEILTQALKYQKQYGLTFRVQLGTNHLLFNADPRLNEIITTSHTLLKKSLAIRYLRNWLGDGLITSDNPIWKVHRRIITPTFHFKILEDFVPTFNKNAKHLVQYLREHRMDEEFDAYEDVCLCSLDTICETAMGITINALRDRNLSHYVESVKFMGQMMMNRAFSSWKRYDFLYNFSAERKVELKLMDHVRNITNDVIKTRRAELQRKKDIHLKDDLDLGKKKRVAFLDHLLSELKQNGGRMSTKELQEEVDTFIFAGHDTVASASSFVIYYLSKHPEFQQRAYEEIVQVYGSDTELTFDKLAELKYLDMVIKETLRLCPSVPIHSRILTEDVHFDGKIIPKGIDLVLFIYGAHRNEQLFKDPEKFDPDRFLDENFTKDTLFGYLPFNAGPRNCIGRKYAVIAMKCLLSLLLKEFKFTKDEQFEVQMVAEGVLKSSNGIRVRIENR